MNKVASGTFRLKGRTLDDLAKSNEVKNAHQASMRSGVPYPTVKTYWEKPETLESVHLPSLAGLLIDAGGLSPEEALSKSLGELFDFVPNSGEATK